MVQYSPQLDAAFAALSDPTRRGILEQLGRSDASISDLAAKFEITLTGLKKHVHILEQSGFVTSKKVGRVRTCRLGPRRLDAEAAWLDKHRQMVESRLDRLGEFLERTKGKS
ncbi:MAG TPA: metalloregulator ArsR/SmtB family transcription factor [Kofleriaceae bacterium]|jgi:DNA-binding transcriptional ArsR family regulator|nr:metalloregulator ArsR/SmtB family transcription factor [Kofleriaceae bacterium]